MSDAAIGWMVLGFTIFTMPIFILVFWDAFGGKGMPARLRRFCDRWLDRPDG